MWVWFCFFVVSVIVVVLVRDDSTAHTWATKRERASSTKSHDRRGGRFLFCLLSFAVLLFFVRHFFLFLAFWFVSCEPEISPRSLYLFFIVLFFVFSRKNGVRFFVCFAFCLLLLLFQSIFKLLIIIFNFTYFLLLLLFVFN